MGFGQQFDNDDFFRDSGQIGYNLTVGTRVVHDLHFGYQRYTDSEDLTRSSNGWGLLTVPGGRLSFQGRPDLLRGDLPAADDGRGAHHPLRVPVAELRVQRHHQARRLDVQPRRPGQQRHPVRPGPAGGLVGPLRLHAGARQQVQDVRDPLQEADPAAPGRDLGLRPEGHGLRELRPLQLRRPARCRAPPPGTATSRPASTPTSTRTASSSRPTPWPHRRASSSTTTSRRAAWTSSCSAPRASSATTGRAACTAATGGAATSGRTRTTTRGCSSTRRRASRASSTSRTSPRSGTRSAADRPTSSPSSTAPTRGTTRRRWRRNGATPRPCVSGSYTWSRYYGNFDQDNSTTDNDLNIFIGSCNIGDGAGRQLWDFKDGTLRGDRPHLLKLYGTRSLPWKRERGRVLRRPVRPALGGVELRALPRPHHLDQRDEPLRREGGLTPLGRALAARPQLHAEHQAGQADQPAARGRRLQPLRQADGLQHRAAGPQLGLFGQAPASTSTRGGLQVAARVQF